MSLKLSVKYDPNSKPAMIAGPVNEPETPVIYLMSGMIPSNLALLSTQTTAFRDLLIANTLSCPDTESVLATFAQQLRCVNGTISQPLDIVYCEYAASLAFASDDMDLFKEILIRVEPTKISPFIRTLYEAALVNKSLKSSDYVNIVKNSVYRVKDQWERDKQNLNI